MKKALTEYLIKADILEKREAKLTEEQLKTKKRWILTLGYVLILSWAFKLVSYFFLSLTGEINMNLEMISYGLMSIVMLTVVTLTIINLVKRLLPNKNGSVDDINVKN